MSKSIIGSRPESRTGTQIHQYPAAVQSILLPVRAQK
jgi:hypothetical protein